MNEDQFATLRRDMVQDISAHAFHVSGQIGKEALDDRVLEAMGKVPRHEFVPSELRAYAYFDSPLPIGFDKTISQPFMVALMTDLLDIQSDDIILEIGTGRGYHAAILAVLAAQVFSIEIIEELAEQATENLKRFNDDHVDLRVGDGSRGLPEHAPFDKILVAAAPELIPPTLINQLKPGGRMVVPAGIPEAQNLLLVEKDAGGKLKVDEILRVSFSPLEISN